jgi:hypothetical protein
MIQVFVVVCHIFSIVLFVASMNLFFSFHFSIVQVLSKVLKILHKIYFDVFTGFHMSKNDIPDNQSMRNCKAGKVSLIHTIFHQINLQGYDIFLHFSDILP